MADKIESYLAEVAEQIRWKQAREGLETELRTHLLDQKDALIAEGMDEEAAVAESVRQMGDPEEIGIQLDRAHRPKAQWGLLTLVGVILLIGLAIQTTVMQRLREWPHLPTVYLSVLIGVMLMLAVYYLDYRWLGRRPVLVYIIGFILLVYQGYTVPYQYSYLSTHVRFMAAYASLVMPVFCYAPLVWRLRKYGWHGFALSILAAAPMLTATMLVPSFTSAIIAYAACFAALVSAVWYGWDRISRKAGLSALGLLVAAAVGFIYYCILNAPYMQTRFQIALNPELDPFGRGYLALQTRQLLSQAKWLGPCGAETLPARMDTDFWLTWAICRMGWAVGLALILLLAVLFAAAFRRCMKQRGPLGRLLSLSALTVLVMETSLYVIYNMGFQLTGPLVLPLLSTSGTYMVLNLLLVGLLLSVFRAEQLPIEDTKGKPKKQREPLFVWQDGDLVLRLSQWKKA